jgi:hypothetical protein
MFAKTASSGFSWARMGAAPSNVRGRASGKSSSREWISVPPPVRLSVAFEPEPDSAFVIVKQSETRVLDQLSGTPIRQEHHS